MSQDNTVSSPRESASPQIPHLKLVAAIYLLGLFIGALDTGIVTPARVVIQNDLSVSDTVGVWMITIYTLAYAVSIPIMGKLADRYGRKGIYLVAVVLFGLGSLGCGLSQMTGSFELLLAARVLQAFGGGGIVPVATAEFGTSFPEEKRGMALGLVGMVYGVANVLGASAGSAIMDIFGTDNWPFIFYINIPICLFIVIAGVKYLPKARPTPSGKLDTIGIMILTLITLAVMYALQNIDFTAPLDSLTSTEVYPYLLAALVLLPFFIWREMKAADPILDLKYFTNRDIAITMAVSIITGIIMMGMVFVPQFAENALGLKEGDGGYLVVVLAVFSGLGAPLSGKFIDKMGVKPVLGFGLIASAAGGLYAAYVATAHPNWPNVLVALSLLGLGLGFAMGTPINYMMLAKTEEKNASSALAALSLVRSLGTAVGPSAMVAFITTATAKLPELMRQAAPGEHAQIAQDVLNDGFSNMFRFVAHVSLFGLLLVVFYREGRKKTSTEIEEAEEACSPSH